MRCLIMMPWGISRRFHRLSPRNGQVAHALRTLAPVAINRTRRFRHAAPRLACVKPAASVHPEPGSNSSLYNNLYFSACPDTYNFTKKLTLLDKLYFLGTCFLYFPSIFSMNFFADLEGVSSQMGCKDTDFFLTSKFFQLFFEKNLQIINKPSIL